MHIQFYDENLIWIDVDGVCRAVNKEKAPKGYQLYNPDHPRGYPAKDATGAWVKASAAPVKESQPKRERKPADALREGRKAR